ncbi:transposase, partial [Chitinophaga dinghuensis]
IRLVEKGQSIMSTSDDLDISPSLLLKWWDYYKAHGLDGLKPFRNHYSGEFKNQVLKAYHREKLTLRATCVRFHLSSDSVLLKWLSIEKEQGNAALYEENRGRSQKMAAKKKTNKLAVPKTREQELEQQLKELKLENEFLKKLHALIQQEEAIPSKKRRL